MALIGQTCGNTCVLLIISDGASLEKQQMIIREKTQKHLDDYAKRGLRTLCIAKKVRLSVRRIFFILPLRSHHLMIGMYQTWIWTIGKAPRSWALCSQFLSSICIGRLELVLSILPEGHRNVLLPEFSRGVLETRVSMSICHSGLQ